MTYFASALAILAVVSLLAIAASTVSIAAAVERERIEKQKRIESLWNFPAPEPPLPSNGDPGFLQEPTVPDWRKRLPPRSTA